MTRQYAAPAVTVTQYGSANVFNIRGIGRSQVDIDVPSGVVIYRDGTPTLAGYFQNEPYFDMAGVEVLRGPQGTLAGKSAAGGAVFFRTEDAKLGVREGFLEGGAGNFESWNVTGMVNLPLSDTLAVRAAYTHLDQNDFWFDSITGDVQMQNGVMHTEAFRLVGPAAAVNISGDVDIAHETQKLRVRVQPALSSGVSMGTAALFLIVVRPVVIDLAKKFQYLSLLTPLNVFFEGLLDGRFFRAVPSDSKRFFQQLFVDI